MTNSFSIYHNFIHVPNIFRQFFNKNIRYILIAINILLAGLTTFGCQFYIKSRTWIFLGAQSIHNCKEESFK